jgi:K+ transporter
LTKTEEENKNVDKGGHFSLEDIKHRYPGIGVFYCYNSKKIPESFLKLTHQLRTMPEHLVFLRIEVVNEPFVADDKRVTVTTDDDIHLVVVR